MVKPVHIFIDRQELLGFTSMNLRRNKNEMTGELTIKVFMGWLPTVPVMVDATKGKEVLVYIGGHLAFTGFIDRRKDTSKNTQPRGSDGRFVKKGSVDTDSGATNSGSMQDGLGPNNYEVEFKARGKTKYLIDCSQQHPTSTMLRVTNREALETLVQPWGTEIVWEASEDQLDKVRFRDGAHVSDEIQRLAEDSSLYVTETRDGRLRITDGAYTETGEPLVLGTNILQFSTDQAEDQEQSEVLVKGQRIEVTSWGEAAVLPTQLKVRSTLDTAFRPLTVQHYGNATPEALAKRAQYEANKRSSISKQVLIEAFHVQQTTGAPWDLGVLHYVEIPPANVFELMEVTELEYIVTADKTLMTKLTFAPAPVKLTSGNTSEFLGDVADVNDIVGRAASRRAQFGVTGTGLDWGGPAFQFIEVLTNPLAALTTVASEFLGGVTGQGERPPLELPPSYKEPTP